jgi:tRNA-splicing ligase RtcB
VRAVSLAQDYARQNRELMMRAVVAGAREALGRPFEAGVEAVNCHHNYVATEEHYGERVFVTRKGAVRAGRGDLGIIPGSMGARSYIVRGKGEKESFESCSHGAGRAMSRAEAKRRFTAADHEKATSGIECRKDEDVIDETPMAYKPIDAVMEAQKDLVEIVHTLRQVVCVKG